MQVRAAIYTRISKDRTGAGLGVERQATDCRQLALLRGWDVVATHVDNDISAYSTRRRPAYEALIRMVKAGEVDVIVAWSHDRLHRRPTELESFIDVCDQAHVDTYTVKAGHFDLSTPSGRAVARTLAAWAAYEVETSTARIRAAKLQAAKSGKFGGGQRPYGWEPGRVAIRQSEAEVVRELAARVTRGESFNSCALDLNRRGITTTHGKEWNALKVRNLLLHKAYAGIREHHDAEYPAEWPAILTPQEWQRLQQAIRIHAEQYKQRGPARRNLLTGFLHCGLCEGRMSSGQRDGGQRRYVCTNCHRVMRAVAPVDLLITESILYRLETPNLAELLTDTEHGEENERLAGLIKERTARRGRLDELADEYMAGTWTKAELTRMKTASETALRQVEREIQKIARRRSGVDMLPVGETVRAAWDKASLTWRRQLIGLLIDRVIIKPSPGAGQMRDCDRWMGYRFRPEDVEIRWLA